MEETNRLLRKRRTAFQEESPVFYLDTKTNLVKRLDKHKVRILNSRETHDRRNVDDERKVFSTNKSWLSHIHDKYATLILFLVSIFSRCLFVNSSPIVVWDEAHFGKFANYYLKRTFYFDVHPPLGKMLIALSGWLYDYKGDFAFESGSTYNKTVPIYQMRMFCAIIGSFIVPLIYGTCKNMGMRSDVSLLVSMCLICDNALLTISKFVLLDSILLCFTAFTIYAVTRLEKENLYPFTRKWYTWLAWTGLSLGCVSSVKWVGLFTYAWVGAYTIRQLWKTLPTIRRSPTTYLYHILVRVIFLIVLPSMIYMSTFYIHFAILNKSGPGDSQMSSRFTASLMDSPINKGPAYMVIGHSTITLRNNAYGGGLLHSHAPGYPVGSKQGQVTLYHHRDMNNNWKLEKPWYNNSGESNEDPHLLRDGSVLRLVHNNTLRNLHSHKIPAPISVFDNEVSTYGNLTLGDEKDHWVVELISHKISDDDRIMRLRSIFRLRHKTVGCFLSSSGQRLPDWGFSQLEVICTKNPDQRAEWNVEENILNSSLDYSNNTIMETNSSFREKASHFIKDFIDLNVAMWNGNNALVPKLGKKDMLISKPAQWPFLDVGLRMCNWRNDTIKYYLLGNPLIWWASTLSIVWYMLHACYLLIRQKVYGFISQKDEHYVNEGFMLLLGWVLHYYPFQMMGRVTYLHHYFPSLIISVMILGNQLHRTRKLFVYSLIVMIVLGFMYMAPLSYGFVGDANAIMKGRQWRSSWNIVDIE